MNYRSKEGLGGTGMAQLNVMQPKGFKLTKMDGEKGRLRMRPGWIGREIGASLDLSLPIDRSAFGSKLNELQVEVIVTFLVSYRHMGISKVSCISCQCEDHLLNGHHKDEISVPTSNKFFATVPKGSMDCIIQVEIVNATDSGEHKFKIIQASIGGRSHMFESKLRELEKQHQAVVKSLSP